MLAKDSRFGDVIILGHSEGSLIGMLAAQELQRAKFISLAGSGIAAGDLIRNQLKEQPPSVLEQASPILEALENGDVVDDIPTNVVPTISSQCTTLYDFMVCQGPTGRDS